MILRKIIGTSGSRILNAISSIVLLWMATNYLGTDAWGTAGLILLDISLLILVADIITNPIIFFAGKRNPRQLQNQAFKWLLLILISSILLFGLLFLVLPKLYYTIVPKGYGWHIIALAGLNSLFNINQYMLLGREKIKSFNILFILQFSVTLIFMAIFIFGFNIRDEKAYVYALYFSFLFTLIPGYSIVFLHFRKMDETKQKASFNELFNFGSMTQLSSIVHTLNKRLGFYVIRNFIGLSQLGVYHSGTQVTEGMRLIGQSIALVQISSIANRDDKKYATELSLQLLKFSVIVTLLAVLFLVMLPESFFAFVFSKSFSGMKQVIFSLGIGVVALSANTIFSHYFAGTGRPKYNLYASLVGLCVTIPALFILIPVFGVLGAGLAASMAYIATATYQWFVFKKDTATKTSELLIGKADIQLAKQAVKSLFKKS